MLGENVKGIPSPGIFPRTTEMQWSNSLAPALGYWPPTVRPADRLKFPSGRGAADLATSAICLQ